MTNPLKAIQRFGQSIDKLLRTLDKKYNGINTASLNPLTFKLNKKLCHEVSQAIDEWVIGGKVRRLWRRDSSLWTGSDEGNWLGWLSVTEEDSVNSQEVFDLAEEIKKEKFSHVLLLGMGGSSLFPEVLEKTFGKFKGYPSLHILDSTDPNQIKSFESIIDLSRTLFIVSSKSGNTLEPKILKQYFFKLLTQILGKTEAGRHFIAITDPGSMLEKVAENDGFRSTFYGDPTIGGRYSALSNFGKVPGILMGLDFLKFIDRAEGMVHACTSYVPAAQNPGVILGTILGVLAKNGKDKVTIITSPEISSISSWLAQLLAESTGKKGKGLIPIDGEPIGSPTVYGPDRLFIYFRLESTKDQNQDQAVRAIEKSGQPVVLISVVDLYDLSQEFFRWEMAIAVAGSFLEINPFDQPDVEASKIATHNLTAQYEKNGSLPTETSFFKQGRITLFADEDNRRAIENTPQSDQTLESILKTHFGRLNPGDYFAILAYLEMKASHKEQLQILRAAIRDKLHNATCLGFGPRFLHSTGQVYKGGPNSGVFLQITCEDSLKLPVPGQKYTFGLVKAAQAQGDFEVLVGRQRRALRVHLTSEIERGLSQLSRAITRVLR